ncbi:leucine-rich repeat extensin-like protein 5 [Ischnura elegans]|uniref:leucine-rich repeat extensin-like protein 5 n=1 Tax=Ischnura elegans TaxID=197161 RepID=UPI001ED8799B|nr:leucine-rich repeat extensin-like protein 5 [Ischnura elegans]
METPGASDPSTGTGVQNTSGEAKSRPHTAFPWPSIDRLLSKKREDARFFMDPDSKKLYYGLPLVGQAPPKGVSQKLMADSAPESSLSINPPSLVRSPPQPPSRGASQKLMANMAPDRDPSSSSLPTHPVPVVGPPPMASQKGLNVVTGRPPGWRPTSLPAEPSPLLEQSELRSPLSPALKTPPPPPPKVVSVQLRGGDMALDRGPSSSSLPTHPVPEAGPPPKDPPKGLNVVKGRSPGWRPTSLPTEPSPLLEQSELQSPLSPPLKTPPPPPPKSVSVQLWARARIALLQEKVVVTDAQGNKVVMETTTENGS